MTPKSKKQPNLADFSQLEQTEKFAKPVILHKTSTPRFLLTQTFYNLKKWLKTFPATTLQATVENSVTFVGHSTLIYDVGGVKIITDPLLYNQIKHIRKNTPIVYESIPRRFDLILLTHFHMDHFHYPSLKLLDKTAQVIAPYGAKKRLNRLGFYKVIETRPGEEIDFMGLKIEAWRCEHDGRRYYRGVERDTLSYLIKSDQYKIFSCGDTAETENFNDVTCDIAFMPVGCYTPMALQDRHCSPEQSFKMFKAMNAKVFVPIHFGTLQLSMDNEAITIRRILELRESDPRLKIVNIGENYSFDEIISE